MNDLDDVFDRLKKAETVHASKLAREPNTFTTGEYAKKLGVSVTVARRHLLRLERDGLIERCSVAIPVLGEYTRLYPGWRLITKKAGAQPL